MLNRRIRLAGPFTLLAALPLLAIATGLTAPQLAAQHNGAKKTDAIELDDLFPEKGIFGPSASGPAFSHDGKYALYLHKTFAERRHGNDLWLVDVNAQKATRLTSPLVMAEFDADARKVLDDRLKKARKKIADSGADAKKDAKDKEKHSDLELMQQVQDDDWDAEKDPRWSGVSEFTWSDDSSVFLFVCGGDVYHWTIGEDAPERLTRTRDSERQVRWLPDGSGYTYLRDDALYRVRFDTHLVEQIDATFPSGERLSGYEISPDGNKVVFLTDKGESSRDKGRTVKIASYRDRFATVREVPRHVSDDPLPTTTTTVYLFDLDKDLTERGLLYKVHSHQYAGPRDVLRTPDWAPDSSRVAFAWFSQQNDQVAIYEAQFPDDATQKADRAKKDAEEAEARAKAKTDGKATTKKGDNDELEQGKQNDRDEAKELTDTRRVVDAPAKEVYRFFHHGGPNTPRMVQPMYAADSRHIVFLSEQSGFRHLHVLNPLYESTRQLTNGPFEVYPIDMDDARKVVRVLSTKEHPSRQDVYLVDVEKGSMQRLTYEQGFHSDAAVSPDNQKVLSNFVSFGRLEELALIDARHRRQKTLTDSHPGETKKLVTAKPEFFTFENRHGHTIHGHLFKPADWSKDDQRPALVYVYGGPLGTRKQVVDGNYHYDSYLLHMYMARKHGFVTCTIDPRGMSGYGAVFEKANFEQVGKPQTEDLVDGVKWLVENAGVDEDRVGLHGWSFGGFQTQMCLYTEPDVFACGIAGAGPTEWENYNSWYSTGTIGASRQGTKEPDLQKFSLLPLAKNLKSRLLLVHGMEDPNVLYQDTVRVYRELLKAGKETLVELFLDPTGGHGLGGDVKRLGRARKYEEFFCRVLGPVSKGGREAGKDAGREAGIGEAEGSAPAKIH